MPKAQIRELCGVVKGLRKVSFDGLAILKEFEMIGLLKGCMWESVVIIAY